MKVPGPDSACVAIALASIGLRPSEIRALKREDIELNAGVLRVRRSAWRSSMNEGGKGKNSVRDVTLGPYRGRHPERAHGSGRLTAWVPAREQSGEGRWIWMRLRVMSSGQPLKRLA